MSDFLYIPYSVKDYFTLILLSAALLFIIFTYIRFYLPVILYKKKPTENTEKKVSVIICARNEAENLTENLPLILNQKYPHYEVILVNDCSIDDTEHVIDAFLPNYPYLKKINIKEDGYYKHGKKMAQFIGIKGAQYDYLVFTDADCKPASDLWLTKIVSCFEPEKEIILGYGKYEEHSSFLNKIIRYDTLTIALQYLSCAIKGNPYMGVGRNLAYKKDLFFKNKGFANHYHIASGDDDLFVNETGKPNNTAVCIDKAGFTISEPPFIFKHWLLQKARHFSTSPLYKTNHKIMLGWIYFSIMFFHIVLPFAIIYNPQLWLYVSGALLIKYIVQTIIFYNAAKKFEERNITAISFILEPLLLFAYIYISLIKKIKKI